MTRDQSPASSREGGRPETAVAERLEPLPEGPGAPLRVLVTGADGFLGTHLVPRLVSRGHRVRALHRGRPGRGRRAVPGLDWRRADVCEAPSLEGLAHGCDVVVHLAGRFEPEEGRTLGTVHGGGTRNVLAEARKSGVRRFVLVSALGASPGGTEFYRTKFEAEDAVLASGLEHVVLRPAVVYGPGDHFTSAIVRILRAFPVFPMLGDGTFRLQPVAVEDVCDALAQSVERPDVVRRTLALAGPEALSFVRIVRIVGETIGRPRAIVPLPEALAAPSSSVAGRLGLPSPIARSQLDLLAGGCVLEPGEPNPLRSVFAVKPLPFADAVADYLGPA